MESRKLFTRRFIFGIGVLFILTALNVGLFYYIRQANAPWSYLEKNDGTVLIGKMTLLEGGYIEVDMVYTFSSVNHLQGESDGESFRIESLNPELVAPVRVEALDRLRIAPSEVKQWGEVSLDSKIYQQLKNENR
jgi:hypothetical protein